MKTKLCVILVSLCLSPSVFALGGAIGGGEITKYPLFSCEASGIDPTFPSLTTRVIVNGEAGYDGFILPDLSVTIELQDVSGKTLEYLPTLTLPANFQPEELVTHQWAQVLPGEDNPMTAVLSVKGSAGTLVPMATGYGEELQLHNCEYMATVQ